MEKKIFHKVDKNDNNKIDYFTHNLEEKKSLFLIDEKYLNTIFFKNIENKIKNFKKVEILILSKKEFKNHIKKKINVKNVISGFLNFGFSIKLYKFFSECFSDPHMLLIHAKKPYFRNKFIHFLYMYFIFLNFLNFFKEKSKNFDQLITVCYYNSIILSAVYSFNVQKKKIFEIQHGYIGEDHAAYSKKTLSQFQKVIPTHILFRDQIQFEDFTSSHLTKQMLNERFRLKTQRRYKKKSLKKVVGITLQTGWSLSEKLIKEISTDKKFKWNLRFHPMDNMFKERCDYRALKNCQNVKFSKSNESILKWFDSIDIHMTGTSATIEEAFNLGLITYTFDYRSVIRYRSLHKKNFLYFINSIDDISYS